MLRLLLVFAFLAAGCACEHGIGLSGDQDAEDETSQSSWDPPIENLGEPGWGDSVDTFCWDRSWASGTWQVWSDPRGVFVQVDEWNAEGTTGEDVGQRFSIMFNDGTGWTERFEDTVMAYGVRSCQSSDLKGIPGGTMYLLQYGTWCEWGTVTDSSLRLERSDFTFMFVVDENLAYAYGPGLVYFDGTSWGPYTETPPRDGDLIWADRLSLFLAGNSGIIMSMETDGWCVHDTHTLESFTAIWGFNGNDVWAGTDQGSLFHWDGTIWEDIEWPDMGDSTDPCRPTGLSITEMWGVDGALFFHNGSQLVMYDGSGFIVLLYAPGDGVDCADDRVDIYDLWGDSADEVFLSVVSGQETSSCWPRYLLWWDGTNFHWF